MFLLKEARDSTQLLLNAIWEVRALQCTNS